MINFFKPLFLINPFIFAGILLLSSIFLSLIVGAGPVSTHSIIFEASKDFNSQAGLVLFTLRLPRTLVAILVGAALAVSGLILQSITRNPLAEPDLLGISASSSLAIVIFILLGGSLATLPVWIAITGAALGCLMILMSARLQGVKPDQIRLVLAGVAYKGLLSAIVAILLLIDQRSADEIRFWTIGSLAGRHLTDLLQALLPVVFALCLTMMLLPALSALSLGEQIASTLGHRVRITRYLSLFSVALMSGSAVALAGPIAFFGLIIPTFSRFLVGSNLWRNFGLCLLLGPSVLLCADIVARLLVKPSELPLGIVTAFLGAPLMVFIVRWPQYLSKRVFYAR